MGATHAAIRWAFRRIMAVYFRDIEATGNVPTANTAGRLFVSNHVNALVDPILVLTTAPCDISPIAKSTLWKIPGLRWLLMTAEAVPVVRRRDDPTKSSADNSAMFDRIADFLGGGGNLLVFPEGTSHNEPHLLPPRTGPARMLVRSAERGARGLTYQSVALEFDARDVFRSRCLLIYGPVRPLDDEPLDSEERVRSVTTRIKEDLSELLVEGATWPERLLIARVAEMLAHDEGDASLARWNSIGRQVEAAHQTLRSLDERVVRDITREVDRYHAMLSRAGLTDDRVAARRAELGADAWRISSGGVLALALPFALMGLLLYAIPYQLPRIIASKGTRDDDEISTYKLAAGLVVYPLWLCCLCAISIWVLPPATAALACVLSIVTPLAALAWLDLVPRVRGGLRTRTRAARLGELRAARARVMSLVDAARARLA
jgi:1-acyl-sn-glycerol-3-phosphate acyltransferase